MVPLLLGNTHIGFRVSGLGVIACCFLRYLIWDVGGWCTEPYSQAVRHPKQSWASALFGTCLLVAESYLTVFKTGVRE